MKKPARRTVLANVFGTLGYISVLFQWVWSLLLFAYPLLKENAEGPLQPHQPSPSLPPVEISPDFAPVLGLIAVVATVAILIITGIVLVRLPKTFGKKAAITTQSTAKAVLPVVTRHKKITKKEQARLSYRIVLTLKTLVIITPLVLLFFTPAVAELGAQAAWAIGIFTAACSLAYFGLQQIIAWVGKIPHSDVW